MSQHSQNISELLTINDVKHIFEKAPANSLFIFDVDDTFITPKDKIFRYAQGNNPFQGFIDEFKKKHAALTDPKQRDYFIKTLANWRLQRKCQLVEEQWPKRLNYLTEKGVIVVALTQMDVGAFGDISSMEDWRYNELKSLGLHFTERFNNQEEILLKTLTDELQLCPRFKKGILYTPKHPKGDVVDAFLEATNLIPSAIVAFDDRLEHLVSLEETARRRSISYQGYFYKAAQQIPGAPNPEVARLQVEYLLKHSEWLSDEEAEKKLKEAL